MTEAMVNCGGGASNLDIGSLVMRATRWSHRRHDGLLLAATCSLCPTQCGFVDSF